MRVCCISDTHEQHRQLSIPPCDVLVHAGDITYQGDLHRLQDFDEWCKELPLPPERIIVIPGNHDLTLEKEPWRADYIFENSTYLVDEAHVIDGVKFYGSPWQPEFYDWAFNLPRGGSELAKRWAAIPDDTDVLITHGPPFGCGDLTARGERVGCALLRDRLKEIKPRFHVCGHIHADYGIHHTNYKTVVVNASSCNEQYDPTNYPILISV